MDPSAPKAALAPALHALAERERRHLGPHLVLGELAAYRERRLAADEVERVRDHLALCSECADLLLQEEAFAAPAAAEAGLLAEEVDAAWSELAPRLADRRRLEEGEPDTRRKRAVLGPWPPSRWAESRILPWSLAAALLLAVAGLGDRAISLHSQLEALARPRADAVVAELLPGDVTTRGGAPQGKRIAAGRPAILLLEPSLAGPSPPYEVEIRGADGGTRWRGAARPDERGFFSVSLPAGRLPPGGYRIILSTTTGGERRPLQDFAFTVVAP